MSKTVSTCILETNQVKDRPQDNIFFHSLYRTQADFPDEFLRTAKSTSPIQICALFSTVGSDGLAAQLNIELNKELEKIVAKVQKNPVLDFESFSNVVISQLNKCVCGFVVSHGGQQLKTSMTMLVIEGDTLRVIHIGNNKAVMLRDNKIMALTEEHTVAHRYVKMGAIKKEEEATHPECNTLTQYLGKLPQDGPIVADKNIHVKLKNDDEICLFGTGISKDMPAQMRNVVLVKPTSTESKARELINSAFNYGVKSGLSVAIFKIESIFLLPGDAVINSNLATEAKLSTEVNEDVKEGYTSLNDEADSEPNSDETRNFNVGDLNTDDSANKNDFEKSSDNISDKKKEKKEKVKSVLITVLIPVLLLVIFAFASYWIMMALSKSRGLISPPTEVVLENSYELMYVINSETNLYSEPSPDSEVIAVLERGKAVGQYEEIGEFSRIKTTVGTEGMEGYIYTVQLSLDDPTVDDVYIPDETDFIEETTTEETTTTSETTTESTVHIPQVSEQAIATTAYTEPPVETTAETVVVTEATEATEATTEATESVETSPSDVENTDVTEPDTSASESTVPSGDGSETDPSESSVDSSETTAETTGEETVPAETSDSSETSATESTVEETTAATDAPETEAPETEAPSTEAPETEAPSTEAPETEAPATEAPETEAPATEAPET